MDSEKSKAGGLTVSERLVEWEAPPPLASIVTVAMPSVAVAVAENETVTLQVGLHGLFVNAAVTPLGKPGALNVTPVVVPLTSVAVIDEAELVEPWTTERLLGDGVERLKSNATGMLTVSDIGTVWVIPPPVTLIVTGVVPGGADAVAVKDTVTLQVGLQGLFVKVALTPEGREVATAEKVTAVVVPLTSVAVIDDVELVPP